MSTAPTVSGLPLYRLDRVMRASEPATLLWATIRMVWSVKEGPPVVMLGDQALTRTCLASVGAPEAAVAFVVAPEAWPAPNGTTVRARPASDAAKYRRGLLLKRRRAATRIPADIIVDHSVPRQRFVKVTDRPIWTLTSWDVPFATTVVLRPPTLCSVALVTLPFFQLRSATKPPHTPTPVTDPPAAHAAGSAGSSSTYPGRE